MCVMTAVWWPFGLLEDGTVEKASQNVMISSRPCIPGQRLLMDVTS